MVKINKTDLPKLLALIRDGEDTDLINTTIYMMHPQPRQYIDYHSSISETQALVERFLPGFWYTSGVCKLSGHASIGPDFNSYPELKAQWPENVYHSGFSEDLQPGSQEAQCLALLSCIVQALIEKECL
jgi:hypothetical protein